VNYKDAHSAAMAIENLNGVQIQNKVIKVSLARPPSTEIKDTNLYITNLPRETTEEELLSMFSPYGNIVQKNILYDKYTQLPRGVAFVR
jgi:protein sex-lethal